MEWRTDEESNRSPGVAPVNGAWSERGETDRLAATTRLCPAHTTNTQKSCGLPVHGVVVVVMVVLLLLPVLLLLLLRYC